MGAGGGTVIKIKRAQVAANNKFGPRVSFLHRYPTATPHLGLEGLRHCACTAAPCPCGRRFVVGRPGEALNRLGSSSVASRPVRGGMAGATIRLAVVIDQQALVRAVPICGD